MNEPLAQRLRPKTLADVCGQQHLLAEGQVFRRTIESGRIPNMIFYGPSGTGKTTVARIIPWGYYAMISPVGQHGNKLVYLTPPFEWIAGFLLLVSVVFAVVTRRLDRIER